MDPKGSLAASLAQTELSIQEQTQAERDKEGTRILL